jgi:hypothetical protein
LFFINFAFITLRLIIFQCMGEGAAHFWYIYKQNLKNYRFKIFCCLSGTVLAWFPGTGHLKGRMLLQFWLPPLKVMKVWMAWIKLWFRVIWTMLYTPIWG